MATEFDADLDRLADLSDDELNALEGRITDAFQAADDGGDDAAMGDLADALDRVRTERDRRSNESGPAGADAAAAPPVAANADPPPTTAGAGESGGVAASEDAAAGQQTAPAGTSTGPATAENTPAASPPSSETPVQSDSPAPSTDAGPAEDEQQSGDGEQADSTSTSTDTPSTDGGEGQDREETTVASGEIEVPAGRAPVVTEPRNVIVAAADIPGYTAGTVFAKPDDLYDAMSKRINTLSRLSGGDGEQVIIASIKSPVPEDRMLYANDPKGNEAKVNKLTDLDSLVAAGGCCAPLTTRYDLWGLGDTDRPVKDALAGFQADRGGIRFFRGPSLADVAGGVGLWTCDDDEAAADGGDDAPVKVCVRVECPEEDTAGIQAITLCMTFGVMSGRVFPELVQRNTALAQVAQARVADATLLAQIKRGSEALNGGTAVYGATRDFLLTLARAAAYFRDRHRLRQNHPMRAILPSWLLDVLRSDLMLNPHSTAQIQDNYGISEAEITQFFTDRSINVTWALDSSDPALNGGGFYAAATGTIPDFPKTVQFALYPEGAWLYLDGGTLDLGIVRDSSLIRSNDYMQFSETFEAAANLGAESWWITQPVEVLGKAACCTDGTAP